MYRVLRDIQSPCPSEHTVSHSEPTNTSIAPSPHLPPHLDALVCQLVVIEVQLSELAVALESVGEFLRALLLNRALAQILLLRLALPAARIL